MLTTDDRHRKEGRVQTPGLLFATKTADSSNADHLETTALDPDQTQDRLLQRGQIEGPLPTLGPMMRDGNPLGSTYSAAKTNSAVNPNEERSATIPLPNRRTTIESTLIQLDLKLTQ